LLYPFCNTRWGYSYKMDTAYLAAAAWGALIEFYGWVCPLTVLENQLRQSSGGTYSTGFIEHYIIPVIYPEGLTRDIQLSMGIAVVVINLFVYTQIVKKYRETRKRHD